MVHCKDIYHIESVLDVSIVYVHRPAIKSHSCSLLYRGLDSRWRVRYREVRGILFDSNL